MRARDFKGLFEAADARWDEYSGTAIPLHIESKRYARFSLHSIYFSKFGK